jgi:hypothetical protein
MDSAGLRAGGSSVGDGNSMELSGATGVSCGSVPTIVPETRQNSVSRAYASQLARSVKWKRVKGLRVKMKIVERRISV